MLLPMREVFDAIAPYLSEHLLAKSWASRIRELAVELPNAFHSAVLEFRLDDDPRVDFSFSAWADSPDWHRYLIDSHARGGRANLALGDHGANETWLQAVPLVWLEFDVFSDRTAAPMVFLCVDPSFSEDPAPRPQLTPMQLREVAAQGLSAVTGTNIEPATLDQLARCAERLPTGGRMLHIASLSTRGAKSLRAFCSLPARSILGWLRAIDWPGDEEQLERMLQVCGDKSSLGVHVENSERQEPYLALEYTRSNCWSTSEQMRPWLERLIQLGAASPEKAQAVSAWLGSSKVKLPSAPWLARISRGVFCKLIAKPDGALGAKAYLCFLPEFILL